MRCAFFPAIILMNVMAAAMLAAEKDILEMLQQVGTSLIRLARAVQRALMKAWAVGLLSAIFSLLRSGSAVGAPLPLETDRDSNSNHLILSQIAIRAYEAKQADWPKERLLPVALAYSISQEHEKAAVLFRRVLANDADNYFAQLGYASSLMGLSRQQEAVPVLKNVWMQTKDVVALVKLARCYAQLERADDLSALLPELIQDRFEDLDDVLGVLCNYALFEPDPIRGREVLSKAVADVPAERIATNPYLAISVLTALRRLEMSSEAGFLEKAIRSQRDHE